MDNEDLVERFAFVTQRIQLAVKASRRIESEIELIAVSKTYPAEDIATLFSHGQRHFGENYIQEWLDKVETLKNLPIVWHVIGHVQSNKTAAVAKHAHWLHTLDSFKIARRLSEQRLASCGDLNVCIQVNISGEASKSGVMPEEVLPLAQLVSQLPNLRLQGLMCLPEDTEDETVLSHQFDKMQELLALLRENHLSVSVLSMGMSGDLELAIAHGATHIRVGSALFGPRKLRPQVDA